MVDFYSEVTIPKFFFFFTDSNHPFFFNRKSSSNFKWFLNFSIKPTNLIMCTSSNIYNKYTLKKSHIFLPLGDKRSWKQFFEEIFRASLKHNSPTMIFLTLKIYFFKIKKKGKKNCYCPPSLDRRKWNLPPKFKVKGKKKTINFLYVYIHTSN